MLINYSRPPNPPRTFASESNSLIIGRRPLSNQQSPLSKLEQKLGDGPFGKLLTTIRRLFGRHIDLDLASDTAVSHLHARISYENGKYWIEDLNSRNGTWVNNKRITKKTRLTPGLEAQVGRTMVAAQIETAQPLPEPVRKPAQAPGSKSPIANVIDATIPPFAFPQKGRAEKEPSHAWRQLKAFYDFSQVLGTATSLEHVLEILSKQLQQAIPAAQRGAVLLPGEQDELLLKAHWPSGAHSVSMTWVKRAFAKREAFIWTAPDPPIQDHAPPSVVYYGVKSALYVPLLVGEQVIGVMYLDNYKTRNVFSPSDLELLQSIANQVAMFIRNKVLQQDLQREKVIRSNLLRQFPPKIADRMLQEYNRLRLGGERVDPVTILVSDVRSFTSISASMEPSDVVRMLNDMFDAFVPIIFEYDGVVDKFVGDSVLAVFGSPEPDDKQGEKAVRAALEMQQAILKLGEGWRVRRLPIFQVGISVHSGPVIHGFIGSAERTEYTVVGDTVNRASRYCDGAGTGEIVISKAVYEHVYRFVDVYPKTIQTKHPETEPALEAFVVKGLKALYI